MLRVTGLSAAIQFNKRLMNKKKIWAMSEQIVRDTVSLMRRYCPVDTGNLMESIKYVKKGPGKFEIIVDVPYAIHLEYGTKYLPIGSVENPKAVTSKSGKSSYRPWIRPAIWQINKMFPNYIKKMFINIRVKQ